MSRADDSASLASRACGNGVARTQRPLPIVFVGATFSAIPFTLLAFATLSLPASLASVLMATTPLFTALVGAVWLRQRLTLLVGVGLALGFGAVVILVGGAPIHLGPSTFLAFGAGLAASFSYAIAGTFVRRRLGEVPPLDLATGQLLAAAGCSCRSLPSPGHS